MSSTQRRRGAGASGEAVAVWAGLGAAGLLLMVTNAAERLTGAAGLPTNPISLTVAVLTGRAPWGPGQSIAATATVLLLTAAGAGAAWWWHRRRGGRLRVDRAAAHLAHRGDLAGYTLPGAAATAARLGYAALPPGLPLGRTVAGGVPLVADWETVAVHIAGPRTGKTTAAVIPAVLHAPGPVLVTSNKRDVVDATRGPRENAGPVWAFDPQGVVGAEPTWWWDPLSFVTDEVKAAQLARLWAHAAREPGARTDDYFSKAGPSLLASLLLAAATDRRPITQVYRWLLDPADDTPARILRAGHPLAAEALEAIAKVNPRQRDGVYQGAAELVSFLASRAAITWVEDPTGARPAFHPAAFIRDGGTLYSLSREGHGSAGPLVLALTVAVTEAAEAHAKASPGGRLPVPMVVVLDEAANVCRWADLPALYSHYGSRGIPVWTFLQSWSQGVGVWGTEGMRALWSAANVKVYGGGVAESAFLDELSKLTGTYRPTQTSATHSRHGRTTTVSTALETVLDVADLGSLPRGRALLFPSGCPATLIRTEPWWTGSHAAAVRDSLARHDPTAPAPR